MGGDFFLPCEAEVHAFEAAGGGGGHADGEEVGAGVAVEVGKDVGHAEESGLGEPGGGAVGELAFSVAFEDIDSGEVAGEDEVEVGVGVDVGKGGGVVATVAFFAEAGRVGDVGELAFSVVEEEVGGVAVVGIVEGFGDFAALVRGAVLAEEDVEVAIVIDIGGGDGLSGGEFGVEARASSFEEGAFFADFIEWFSGEEAEGEVEGVGGEDVDAAVAIEVAQDGAGADGLGVGGDFGGGEAEVAVIEKDGVGSAEEDVGESVAVEVINEDGVEAFGVE